MSFLGGLFSTENRTNNNTSYNVNETIDTSDRSNNNAGDGLQATGGSTINYTTTDHGAISGAVEMMQNNTNFAQNVVHDFTTSTAGMFTNGLGFAQAAMQGALTSTANANNAATAANTNALAQVKDAFSTAKSGEQKIMAIAALVIVAVVAVKSGG